MTSRFPAALVAAITLLALPSLAIEPWEVTQQLREIVAERMKTGRLRSAYFDTDAVLGEIEAMMKNGTTGKEVSDTFNRALKDAFYSFAPVDPKLDDGARYRLPFQTDVPRRLSQGVEGTTHSGSDRFALDFAMPEGARVVASREGMVVRVVDGFTESGTTEEFKGKANMVIVLHEDGSYATYAHLQRGIPVSEGLRVRAGDLLGYSGNTGWSTGPHLHFAVNALSKRTDWKAVNFVFTDAQGSIWVPLPGYLYPPPESATAPAPRQDR